ncbi:MAG: ankyrin repeat domain-containing protein, partial [Verrucomicrobia bacterium]|nr:ankyrin repeat domain-containing protein [Verrucomicrobiota bacterium]
ALRQRRSVEFVEWLINSPLVFKTKLPADEADHPLMSLVRYGYARYPELFENLLLKSRSSLTQSTLNDIVELLLFAKHPYTKTFEALLNHINDLNWSSSVQDSNLLFQSIILGKNELLEMLISKGADLSYVDENRMSALHIATIAGNSLAVELLLKNGAKDTSSEHSAKYYATLLNRQEVLDKLPFREGEEMPKPFEELDVEYLMKKIPISLKKSIFNQLSIQEKHIALMQYLFARFYAFPRPDVEFPDSFLRRLSFMEILHNFYFKPPIQSVLDIIAASSNCSNITQAFCQQNKIKYEKIAKRMQNGENVVPVYSRSVDFKQLQQYVEFNLIQYAHRGFSGLWAAKDRLSEYGDYAIWFSQDIEKQPMCSTAHGIGLAGSIDWSQVVQISCPEEEKEKVEILLQSNGLNVPVVSHEEADFGKYTFVDTRLGLLSPIQEIEFSTLECPRDYRNKNTVEHTFISRSFLESIFYVLIFTCFGVANNFFIQKENSAGFCQFYRCVYNQLPSHEQSFWMTPPVDSIEGEKEITKWLATQEASDLLAKVTCIKISNQNLRKIPDGILHWFPNLAELVIEGTDPEKKSASSRLTVDLFFISPSVKITLKNLRVNIQRNKGHIINLDNVDHV